MRRRVEALDGAGWSTRVLSVPGKKASPAMSCGRRGRRNALGKGRGARGGRGEARGVVSRLFHVLEEATHLGGLQPTGWRLQRHVAAAD